MARQRKARKKRHHRQIALFVLVVWATLASASQNCAHFNFPSLQQNKISWKEHTAMTLRFALNIDNCPKDDDKSHFVYVAKMTDKSSSDVEFCAIRLTQEVCFSYKPQNCRCVKEHGRWQVLFDKVMTQSDNGPWLWQTGDGLTETIDFDVQPDTSKKDNALASPGEVEVNLAAFRGRSDDSKASERGPLDVPVNPRTRPKEKILTSRSKEQKTPTKISPIRAEYFGDDNNDDRNANPFQDEVRVTDDGDEDKDDNGDGSFSNSLTTGVVVGTLNVISIVVVLVIVFLCRKRKERKARGSPKTNPPPPPVWRESYVSSRTAQSGVYDEIPAARPSFENETYLVPVVLRKSYGENTYMSLA